ncbi:hypothetical protein [Nocardioides sp. InS609-2]|uniref:VOC family protein n=1 Tax=Nocardioides sp. InS609-2 TaxID=2760705 RepID=UPI0020BEF4CE|nr:hypothetical protein [Nocardioides sp. InS609-2]
MADGKVGHVELVVDGARWMMADEFESAGVAGPDPTRGRGPEDSPPAGRVAVFRDPFGHRWLLNTGVTTG